MEKGIKFNVKNSEFVIDKETSMALLKSLIADSLNINIISAKFEICYSIKPYNPVRLQTKPKPVVLGLVKIPRIDPVDIVQLGILNKFLDTHHLDSCISIENNGEILQIIIGICKFFDIIFNERLKLSYDDIQVEPVFRYELDDPLKPFDIDEFRITLRNLVLADLTSM